VALLLSDVLMGVEALADRVEGSRTSTECCAAPTPRAAEASTLVLATNAEAAAPAPTLAPGSAAAHGAVLTECPAAPALGAEGAHTVSCPAARAARPTCGAWPPWGHNPPSLCAPPGHAFQPPQGHPVTFAAMPLPAAARGSSHRGLSCAVAAMPWAGVPFPHAHVGYAAHSAAPWGSIPLARGAHLSLPHPCVARDLEPTVSTAVASITTAATDLTSLEAMQPPWDAKRTDITCMQTPGPGSYDPAPIPCLSFNTHFTPNPELPGYGRFHSADETRIFATRRMQVRQARGAANTSRPLATAPASHP